MNWTLLAKAEFLKIAREDAEAYHLILKNRLKAKFERWQLQRNPTAYPLSPDLFGWELDRGFETDDESELEFHLEAYPRLRKTDARNLTAEEIYEHVNRREMRGYSHPWDSKDSDHYDFGIPHDFKKKPVKKTDKRKGSPKKRAQPTRTSARLSTPRRSPRLVGR